MDLLHAAERLSALGHETRLSVFRLLVEAGPDGLAAGVVSERLSLPATTLSFHLAHLNRVGLIKGRQASRFIFYAADYTAMDDLMAYLVENCCEGDAQCLPKTTALNVKAKKKKSGR